MSLLFADFSSDFVKAAQTQIGKTIRYNPAYQKLTYPNGDIRIEEGVCTDVVVRALRKFNIDLQKLIHEDIKTNYRKYPKKKWFHFLGKPDANIDHRRVNNIQYYLQQRGWEIKDKKYRPGDIIVWDLGRGLTHIDILSDGVNGKRPLVIHNISCGVKGEDVLFAWKIIGHFRIKGESE